ncbi:hypothetical protein K0504_10015 [Neiella marina]|uniref:Uncharacterized protein n=1 Tax=Neiella holothuriorum TaxID=2870530 RepID=A0ABS7EGA9_9GAMM|nr:TraB/VirB10 family protein [Neiella holothuriorum]MBW8191373.1 hypothetical protein [Neiella holothuriorum]
MDSGTLGSIQAKIKEQWEKPNVRKLTMAIIFVPVLYLMISAVKERGERADKRQERRDNQPESVEIFETSSVTQLDEMQLEAMKMQLEDEAKYQMQSVKQEREQSRQEIDELGQMVAKLQSELGEMKRMQKVANRQRATNQSPRTSERNEKAPPQTEVVAQQMQQAAPQTFVKDQTTILTRNQPIEGRAIRTVTQRRVREVTREGGVTVEDVEGVRTLSQRQPSESNSSSGRSEKQESTKAMEFFLPAGSIMSGTLLNGVDAPTNNASRSDPMPILLRIKKEALLPNQFTMDVRECHLLAGAAGKLSSERVEMRAEAISCVLNDGRAIEKNLTAYAVSSYDGKVGIRGRLVSRNGSAIARAMMAGFVSGIADASAPSSIQAIDESPGSSTLFQSADYGDIFASGAFNGASSAMERLADYYTSMAENMYPVIELSPGTQVDFIVQKGMSFKIKS